MKASRDALDLIAADVGVLPYAEESEESFARRTIYSAARFWIMGTCLDDGADSVIGLSKQAINYRLKKWLHEVDNVLPGTYDWFDANGRGIASLYNRMIAVGDLQLNGFKNTYLTTAPELIPLSRGFEVLLGFFDASDKGAQVCGVERSEFITSGLLTFLPPANSEENPDESRNNESSSDSEVSRKSGKNSNDDAFVLNEWWHGILDYLFWEPIGRYENLQYADPTTSRWNVNLQDVWMKEPVWVDGLCLAKMVNGTDRELFVGRRVNNRTLVCKISWIEAQNLFFYLRALAGNNVRARYTQLDDKHVRIVMPIGFLPTSANRWLDALSWPVDNAAEKVIRIVRAESLPLIDDLLSACYVVLEEAD